MSSTGPVRQRAVNKRSKNGCITCKIRHVKCSEIKPSCTQCTSTGRDCDYLLLLSERTKISKAKPVYCSTVRQIRSNVEFEEVFQSVEAYSVAALPTLNFDKQGSLLAPDSSVLQNTQCTAFESHCFTATMRHPADIRLIEKAFDLVEAIIQAERPQTLICFFEVLLHLLQNEFHKETKVLLAHIGQASRVQQNRPWYRIYWLLSHVVFDDVLFTLERLWAYIVALFAHGIGHCNPIAISMRLDYIKRVYGTSMYKEEELYLNALLKIPDIKIISTLRIMLSLGHNFNKQSQFEKANKVAEKALRLLESDNGLVGMDVQIVECREILSQSYNMRRKAEENTTGRGRGRDLMVLT